MKLYVMMVLTNLGVLAWLYWWWGIYMAVLGAGLWLGGYSAHKHRSYLRNVAEMKALQVKVYGAEKIREWWKS